MAQKYGSSERGCRFHSKMRIWCFSRLLLSIKLLKCFGNNSNKNPVKYISRCFYGKFPRQLLSEKKKFKLKHNPVILKAQRSPVRLNAALCVRCVRPPLVDRGRFFTHWKCVSGEQLKTRRMRRKPEPQADRPQGAGPRAVWLWVRPCPSLGPKQEFKQLGKASGPHCARTCRYTRDSPPCTQSTRDGHTHTRPLTQPCMWARAHTAARPALDLSRPSEAAWG